MITRVEEILTLAKKTEKKYRMVVACAESLSALETADMAQQRGLVESILVGQRSKMELFAQELCIDLNRFDVRDVAEMHLRALKRSETKGKRYLAVAGQLGMVEMGRALKAAYPTRKIPTMQAPLFLLKILALFDAQLRTILPSLGKDVRVSNVRAVRDMGMTFTAPKAALLASADWLEKHGKVWK